MSASVLIIDDEELFREDIASLLQSEGLTCRTAGTGERGLALAEEEEPDVVVCDLMLPGMSGIEVTDRLAQLCPETPVLLVTAFGTLETALTAFRKGAADYLLKPVVPEDLFRKVVRCVEERRLRREVRYLRRLVSESGAGSTLVGDSPALQEVRRLVSRVAGAATTVLVTGETGTGKEVVARAIHEAGRGPERPFVALNCAALPRELFESELFGHVRGAFTGALRDHPGHLQLASGGTLLLDEVGELPLELQPKLLRALEVGEVLPVGARRAVPIDARIVAATHRDLAADVEAGRFREDLYYRLQVIEIHLPPLRRRREDVPPLVEHLVRRLNRRLGRRVLGVDRPALQILMGARWKGNVRELENVLERAILLADGDRLGVADFPDELTGGISRPTASDDLRTAVRAFEGHHIRQVLDSTGGNREEAARRLGIDPSTLYRRLKDLESSGPEE